MSATKTISAKVLRDFNDAGSESRFTKGKAVPLEVGVFDNYRAAGLVEAASEDAATVGGAARAPRPRD